MLIPKTLYGIYVLLRLGEAGEIGSTCYAEAQDLLLAVIFAFAFVVGLAVVLAGVHKLGERVAIVWHVVLEIMLLPLSIHLALAAANAVPSATSVLINLSPHARFGAMLALFLGAQFLLALAGFHIVKWLAQE